MEAAVVEEVSDCSSTPTLEAGERTSPQSCGIQWASLASSEHRCQGLGEPCASAALATSFWLQRGDGGVKSDV